MAISLAEGEDLSVADLSVAIDHRRVLSAVDSLPDHCAPDVGALAARVGADKLDLIRWAREDIVFARLIASKVRI